METKKEAHDPKSKQKVAAQSLTSENVLEGKGAPELVDAQIFRKVQQTASNPSRLSPANILYLQRTLGNDSVSHILYKNGPRPGALIQRETVEVNDETYKIVGTMPGTGLSVVRLDYKPWSNKYLYDPATGKNLPMPMTNANVSALSNVFADLERQGVRKLDELMQSVVKANMLATPVTVLIGRLRLINENIRSVVMLRLRADHAELIANGMLSANVSPVFEDAFNSLEIPGSDPHKGGQVVVFAKYNTNDPDTKEKIVYKPGDLGVDNFLFGSDAGSIANSLGVNMASYQITEKVDATATDERLRHYGYMEFVKTEGPQDAADVTGIYESLGEALITACIFGLRDLHEGNYLMRKNKIMLLDMEAATGTFSGFTSFDQKNLFRDIEAKIGESFTPVTNVDFNTPGFIPDDAALSTSVVTGATRQLGQLEEVNTDTTGNDYAGTFATKSARFVPFATNILAKLAASFFGKLDRPSRSERNRYDRECNTAIDESIPGSGVAPMNEPALRIDLKVLLDDQATKLAFHKGDVPYWTRRGNDLYSEEGNLIVAGFHHPRLESSDDIATHMRERADPLQQANILHALQTQLTSVNQHLGMPATNIKAKHAFARLLAHLPD